MGRWAIRIGLGTALCAVGLGAACSSESSCEETRTCGSAGTGGSAGADASTDAPIEAGPQCTKDEECDDGSACNGSETCSNGICSLGQPVVCSSPDPAHCQGVCVDVGSGQTECTVEPNDKDGDFHGDLLCTQAPTLGDDCDDSNVAVHGTAKEICDGVDNDCNGKADLFDGLPLGGTNAPIVVSPGGIEQVDAVWSEAAKVYGIVWRDFRNGAPGEIYFTRMDASGNEIGDDVRITNDSDYSLQPRIAAGGSELAVLWANGASELRVQRINGTDGQFLGPAKLLPEPAEQFDVVEDGSGGWIAVWASFGDNGLRAAKLQPQGDPVLPITTFDATTVAPKFIRLARSGSVLALTYAYGGILGGDVRVELRSVSDLSYQTGTLDSPIDPFDAVLPFITTGSGQFFSTWGVIDIAGANPGSLVTMRLSPSGAQECVNTSTVTSTEMVTPFSAAFDGKDFAIAYADGPLSGGTAKLRLLFVDTSCNPASPAFDLSAPPALVPVLAHDGNNLAVFHADPNAAGTLVRRMIPASRCE